MEVRNKKNQKFVVKCLYNAHKGKTANFAPRIGQEGLPNFKQPKNACAEPQCFSLSNSHYVNLERPCTFLTDDMTLT